MKGSGQSKCSHDMTSRQQIWDGLVETGSFAGGATLGCSFNEARQCDETGTEHCSCRKSIHATFCFGGGNVTDCFQDGNRQRSRLSLIPDENLSW
jgi:hypothetical protein